MQGIGEKVGTGGQAFGRSAEGSPPTGTGFFQEEKFCAILGADEAGGDNLGVIKDQEVVFLE